MSTSFDSYSRIRIANGDHHIPSRLLEQRASLLMQVVAMMHLKAQVHPDPFL